MISVNTNTGAAVALQSLNATGRDLQIVQNRVSTGQKVATAKDDGAVWAVANKMKSDVSAYDKVSESTDRAGAMLDTATAAGTAISDLLNQMKSTAVAASQTGLSASAQANYDAQFKQLRDQVTSIIKNASFDGANMIGATPASAVALGDAAGTALNNITIAGADLSLGGSVVTVTATSDVSTAALAGTSLGLINTSIDNLNKQLATWGAGSARLDNHKTFVGKLQDALNSGISSLTDADLTKESAKLTALQTKQQLGVQALSIANQSSQIALSLFR
ncbi:MAG: flagellin [Caulobacterales bacterium]|nr:flagellin [Caulobacterales bacterium]MCA0371631.1 flagellin [Pseudomonadota bacterium]